MNIHKIAGLIPVLCLIGNTALAEGVYLGAKAGVMKSGVSELDDATNVGAVIGYEFGEPGNGVTWAIEGEFTTTTSEGDISVFGLSGDWEVDTQAIYGVARFGGDIFGKVRLGYLREDVSASIAGISFDGNDSGLSVGIGAGWRFSDQLAIEAEYTLVEEDLDFYSLGLNFSF